MNATGPHGDQTTTAHRRARSVSRSLSATVEAPGQARRLVADVAKGLDRDLVDDIRLVASELVANAVLHSRHPPMGAMRLRLRMSEEVLRMELRYGGPGFEPRVIPPDIDSERGRGLYIVDRLADRWGVVAEDGLRAWAEWDIRPGAASTSMDLTGETSRR
jgi:anti-sigma regulatory factor (Ser/Thr protein kinase)